MISGCERASMRSTSRPWKQGLFVSFRENGVSNFCPILPGRAAAVSLTSTSADEGPPRAYPRRPRCVAPGTGCNPRQPSKNGCSARESRFSAGEPDRGSHLRACRRDCPSGRLPGRHCSGQSNEPCSVERCRDRALGSAKHRLNASSSSEERANENRRYPRALSPVATSTSSRSSGSRRRSAFRSRRRRRDESHAPWSGRDRAAREERGCRR